MMERLQNDMYQVCCGAEGACLSVAGDHGWVGAGPSFFIPAAKLWIGRFFSVTGALLRRMLKRVCRFCWRVEQREGRFCLAGAAVCGRLVVRRC